MKIAFVMADGLEQFVLTPESDNERRLLGILTDDRCREVSIHKGDFYNTRGYFTLSAIYGRSAEENSAIICLRKQEPDVTKTASEVINDEVPEMMS